MTTAPVGVGIIGTGVIFDAYMTAARQFPVLHMSACADIRPKVAQAKAEVWGLRALSVEDLLADPGISIVLNLTTPRHHVAVNLQAIAAGKHVYGEKPLGVTVEEGQRLIAAADAAGLRVGSAPDTFLGGAHQAARALIDAGAIGRVVAGTAHMMVPGHEGWHPAPDFYYQPGGGPMLDMGPYYLTQLVNLLGPVRRVTGSAAAAHAERVIGSGPRAGERVAVEVPTHITGLLDFAIGAQVTLTTSFDVIAHEHAHMELYGTEGSLVLPDPNQFGGAIRCSRGDGWEDVPQHHGYDEGNWRSLGLADMAQAIVSGRPHRASGALALHVLEIMEGIERSAQEGRRIDMTAPADRPAPLAPGLAVGDLGG